MIEKAKARATNLYSMLRTELKRDSAIVIYGSFSGFTIAAVSYWLWGEKSPGFVAGAGVMTVSALGSIYNVFRN
jgi:hypothetical protein